MTRFAFYGRVSTEDQQDPTSSRSWQLARARPAHRARRRGASSAEFFDIGQSRSLPWKRRPESAALLEALKRPGPRLRRRRDRRTARAFYGNQFGLTFPVFVHYGVELWVPEVGGRVDPGSDAHDLVMSLYGGMSKGERNRIKIRVPQRHGDQAQREGRFLGGRPPYGYRLADAGPHPNPGKAAIGQRLHRLERDPTAAPIVARIFAEYLAGAGLYAIAEGLTRDRVPSPVGARPRAQPAPRRARRGRKSAVRAILTNPRYTGRQVWNRQRRDEVLVDVDDVALGHETKLRWNDKADWIWSTDETHEALVSADDYVRVQEQMAAGRNRPAIRKARSHAAAVPAARAACSAGSAAAAWAASTTTTRRTTGAATPPSTRSPTTSTIRAPCTSARPTSSPSSMRGSPASSTPSTSTTRAPSSPRHPSPATSMTPHSRPPTGSSKTATRALDRYRPALESGTDPDDRRPVDRARSRAIVSGPSKPLAIGHSRRTRGRRGPRPHRGPRPDRHRARNGQAGHEGRALREPRAAAHLPAGTGPGGREGRPGRVCQSACRRGDLNPHVPKDTSPSS